MGKLKKLKKELAEKTEEINNIKAGIAGIQASKAANIARRVIERATKNKRTEFLAMMKELENTAREFSYAVDRNSLEQICSPKDLKENKEALRAIDIADIKHIRILLRRGCGILQSIEALKLIKHLNSNLENTQPVGEIIETIYKFYTVYSVIK